MSNQVHWRHTNMSSAHTKVNGVWQITEMDKARCGPYIKNIQNLVYVDEMDKVTCKNCLKYHKVDLKLLKTIKPYRIYHGVLGWNTEKEYFFVSNITRLVNQFNQYNVSITRIWRTVYMRKKHNRNIKFKSVTITFNVDRLKEWKPVTCQYRITDKEVLMLRSYFKLVNGC